MSKGRKDNNISKLLQKDHKYLPKKIFYYFNTRAKVHYNEGSPFLNRSERDQIPNELLNRWLRLKLNTMIIKVGDLILHTWITRHKGGELPHNVLLRIIQ